MTTKICTKYCLSVEQIDLLVDSELPTKITWYLQNLTTKEFINYSAIFNIHRVSGADQLNLEFSDGFFPPGTEIKAGVGDWNVVDQNGRHCQQTAFWYVNENGEAIMCKYKELPSQNGGVAPAPRTHEFPKELMQDVSIPTPPPVPTNASAVLEAPPVQEQSSKDDGYVNLTVLNDHVACMLDGKTFCVHQEDNCSSYEPKNGADAVSRFCKQCKHSRKLFAEIE